MERGYALQTSQLPLASYVAASRLKINSYTHVQTNMGGALPMGGALQNILATSTLLGWPQGPQVCNIEHTADQESQNIHHVSNFG